MNTLMLTFVITCFASEFIGQAAGGLLKDDNNQENHTSIKRSPSNNFSLFGIKTPFSVPDPVANAKQTLSSFGKLFAPAKNAKIEKPVQIQDMTYEINHIRETTATSTLSTTIKTFANSLSDVSVKLNAPALYGDLHKHDKNTTNHINNIQGGDKHLNPVNVNGISDTLNKDNDTDKKNDEVVPIDKDFIDFIFKDLKNENLTDSTSTTEDSTLEYTTETGEYESTTTDELLRIPAPVLATLLGR